MRVAIYVGPFVPFFMGRLQYPVLQYFIEQLAGSQPQHQFVVVGTKSWASASALPQLTFAPAPNKKTGWLAKWLQRKRQQQWLKQWQPDVCISTHPSFAPTSRSIPHYLLWHSDWQGNAQLFFSKKPRATKGMLAFTGVWLAWPWQQLAWQKLPAAKAQRVATLGGATLPCFTPANWAARTSTKTAISGGEEYYLYAGTIDNVTEMVALLKAFSSFKKRQRTNMKLVIQCTSQPESDSLQQKLQSYKYRNEICLQTESTNPEALARLAAASYGVLVPYHFSFGWWLVGLLQCETAIICPHTSATAQMLDEAAIFVEDWQADVLSEAMMLLYKDEAKRGQLLLTGSMLLPKYTWQGIVHNCWQAIENTGSTSSSI